MQDMATTSNGSHTPKEPYPFAVIGEQIAAALIEAAQNQVTAANNVLENAKIVADGIRSHIKEQSKLLSEANERLVMFSKSITDAHDKFNGK
jgi:predicted  nucleic acid-binding Zn-ribbon protein